MTFFRRPDRKIAVISIPTAGHIKPLIRLAQDLKQNEENVRFTFILTSWNGYGLNIEDKKKLNEVSDKLIILEAPTEVKSGRTYSRALALTDSVINLCLNHHEIIYDFMTPEGYIAGQKHSCPTTCVNPAFIGAFNPESDEFKVKMKQNEDDIKTLEQKYKVELIKNIQLISDQLSVQSPINIVFSWKNLICNNDFFNNRDQFKYFFMRPSHTKAEQCEFQFIEDAKKQGKKIIYFCLGTIAPGIAWDIVDNNLRPFIKSLYTNLYNIAKRRTDLEFIISAGRNPNDIIGDQLAVNNVHLFESLNQVQLLTFIDLFITHCGGNSANEAIDSEVPIIGIPLMFDQHECAEQLEKLGVGISFRHSNEDQKKAADLFANIYFRESLTEASLENAINTILSTNTFKENYSQLKSDQCGTLSFNNLIRFLDNKRKLTSDFSHHYG